MHSLRTSRHLLQLVQKSALPEMSGRCSGTLAGKASPGTSSDALRPCGFGFACKDIGIDIGWDMLSLDNTCPEIVLRPAILLGPDCRTMISSSPKWNDCMMTKRQSPLLPAVIVVLLLALLVFLLVSRKETGVSHPQSATQDR
jgi:hypothetical protein